jgi:cobalt-zinc-cadmium efflux system outer membrane protein
VKVFPLMLVLISLSGCASYRPFALSQSAVRQRLQMPSEKALRIDATKIHHPLLAQVPLNFKNGIGPDQAAVLAVILNPTLRANRDRRGLAGAQLIQAGILPNPTVGYSRDTVAGGSTNGTVAAYGFTGSWDFSALVSRPAKIAAARANTRSIDLDIAWTEWQTAEAAKLALYRVVALQQELSRGQQIDEDQQKTVETLQTAVDRHEKSGLKQELDRQRLEFKRAVGVLPEAKLQIEDGIKLPSYLLPPSESDLTANVESRRLDLLGLHQGYQSQEQTLRAAVLAQFPKVTLGFSRASDTGPGSIHTFGFAITIELPVFDRNQGAIATEKATRQKLFDEYVARVFEAHADIATAIADIRSLNSQIAAAVEALLILQNLVEIAQKAVDEGEGDVLSYFQARTNLNQKTLQLIKLKQQLMDARSALELASGRYLPAHSEKDKLE